MQTKRVQARVLTCCPLCGFRQRLDRLLDLDYQLEGMDGLLPLELAVVYADRRASGLHCELEPLKVKDAARAEMMYGLAAKLFPLVVYLRSVVPEFGEALSDEIITTVQPERNYQVELDELFELVREAQYERQSVLVRERLYKVEVKRLRDEVMEWRTQKRLSEKPMVVLGSLSRETETAQVRERLYKK